MTEEKKTRKPEQEQKQEQRYVPATTLVEFTGLELKEVLQIIQHYGVIKDEAGNVHLGNFLRFLVKYLRETCTLPELADILNLKERTITKLVQQGTFKKEARGLYNRAVCLTAYIGNLRKENEVGGTESEERRRNLKIQGDARLFKLQKEKANYVHIDDLRREHTKAVLHSVNNLEQLQAQLPDELAGCDADEIRVLLKKRLNEFRETISKLSLDESAPKKQPASVRERKHKSSSKSGKNKEKGKNA